MARWLCLAVLFAAPLGCATSGPPRIAPIPAEPPESEPDTHHAEKADLPAPVKQARRSTGEITRGELTAVLDAAPGRFLAHVDTEPRFIGGRFRGWRLAAFFPGDDRFAAVDLQAGDVVLTVNGQSIERPDQLMRVWESLRAERKLVVDLERDGQPRQLRYEIRD